MVFFIGSTLRRYTVAQKLNRGFLPCFSRPSPIFDLTLAFAWRQHFGNNEDISFSFRAAGIHELKQASESRWVQKVVRKAINQS